MSTVQSTLNLTWPSGLEHLHSCTFLCCSSSGSWPPSCGCGWSSCRCWWGWSGLGEHKTGIVCVLISGDLLNSQFPVLLPDPLLRPVGSLEACIAGKEAIVPDVEAALSSRRLHTEVDQLHPHLFSSGAKEHSRGAARLKTDCALSPEPGNHFEDMASQLKTSLSSFGG